MGNNKQPYSPTLNDVINRLNDIGYLAQSLRSGGECQMLTVDPVAGVERPATSDEMLALVQDYVIACQSDIDQIQQKLTALIKEMG